MQVSSAKHTYAFLPTIVLLLVHFLDCLNSHACASNSDCCHIFIGSHKSRKGMKVLMWNGFVLLKYYQIHDMILLRWLSDYGTEI